MCNTKIICTYNTDEIFEPTDKLTERDKEFVRDVIYRQELLNILELGDYNNAKIDNGFRTLYEKIKFYTPLQEIMRKLAGEVMSEDEEVGLIILFSYDFMYQSHKCISELLETNNISDENINLLKILIKF
jgi:hypothetical protein